MTSKTQPTWLLITTLIVCMFGSLQLVIVDGWAQKTQPFSTVGFQSGMVTAIHEKTIQIDGREYGLMPDVVILDEDGNTLDLGNIVPNIETKFHLKKDKIDKMILILPR